MTQEDCISWCGEETDCTHWTWVKKGDCYLKNSDAGRKKSTDYTSGTKNCATDITTTEPLTSNETTEPNTSDETTEPNPSEETTEPNTSDETTEPNTSDETTE